MFTKRYDYETIWLWSVYEMIWLRYDTWMIYISWYDMRTTQMVRYVWWIDMSVIWHIKIWYVKNMFGICYETITIHNIIWYVHDVDC